MDLPKPELHAQEGAPGTRAEEPGEPKSDTRDRFHLECMLCQRRTMRVDYTPENRRSRPSIALQERVEGSTVGIRNDDP